MRDHPPSQVVIWYSLGVAMGAEDLFCGLFGDVHCSVHASQSCLQVFCAANACAMVSNKINWACAWGVAMEGDGLGSAVSLMVGIPAVVAPKRVLD